MLRKVVEKVADEQLQKDLQTYRQRAFELGATDAKIITTDVVVIDERVRVKCVYPKCGSYGTNAHCPPHAMDLDLVRKVVNNFQYAIFIMLKASSKKLAGGPESREKKLWVGPHTKMYEIIAKIESEANRDGYYLSTAFSAGPCKAVFCPNDECSALVPGKGCRHSLKARGSMSGAGMDAYAMAVKVGWDIYPLIASTGPSSAPFGVQLGIVLVY
jgi:predicted metal-binding protein